MTGSMAGVMPLRHVWLRLDQGLITGEGPSNRRSFGAFEVNNPTQNLLA
jgi:hypothetical protein